MFELIKKLQKESESKRRGIALAGSLLITLLIFTIWISTLGTRISNQRVDGESQSASPVRAVFDIISGGFKHIGTYEYNR